MARTGEGERLIASERDAADVVLEQAGGLITGRVVEVDRHAVDGGHQRLEALEVDHRVVVDRDVEVLLDGLDETFGTTDGERGVDAALTATGDVDPEISWQRQQRGRLRLGVDPQDHDGVGVEGLAPTPEHRIAVGQAHAVVDADEQDVLHIARRGERCERGAHIDAGQRRGLGPRPAETRRCCEAGEDHESGEREHEALGPGA